MRLLTEDSPAMRGGNHGPGRAGISLPEVLVSFFILSVGVSLVIALFPVGVMQVQMAVNDTKATNLAYEARATIESFRWPDDSYLLFPPHQEVAGVPSSTDPPTTAAGPGGGDPRGVVLQDALVTGAPQQLVGTIPATAVGWGGVTTNAYAAVPDADGRYQGGNNPLKYFPVGVAAGPGYPVLVDPALANSSDFQHDTRAAGTGTMYKRVTIGAGLDLSSLTPPGAIYSVGPPFAGQLNDVPVYSLSDVQYVPAGPNGGAYQQGRLTRRDTAIKRFFYSNDELLVEERLASVPLNPGRMGMTGTADGWRYTVAANSGTDAEPPAPAAGGIPTAATAPANSYAFVVRNRRIDPAPGYQAPQGWDATNIQVMVFHKRAVDATPYSVVAGCLFSGSSKATIVWDTGVVAVPIRAGQWLMEATLSRGLRDDTPVQANDITAGRNTATQDATTDGVPEGYTRYRHAIEFHQVESAAEVTIVNNRAHQVVTLREPVGDFPVAHQLGDARTMPDPFPANAANAVTCSGPNIRRIQSGTSTVWVPIVLWKNLMEVYSVRN